MGPCQPDQHRIVKVIAKRPLDCKCKNFVLQKLRMRCGCPKVFKHIYGPCKNAQQVVKLVTLQATSYKKKLDSGELVNSTRCQPVVVSRRERPCGCTENPKVLRKCLPGNLLQVNETKFRFNDTTQTCQKETVSLAFPTVCPAQEKQISKCGGEESGYTASEIVTTWTPIDCICVPKTTEHNFICNCSAKYPARTSVSCKNDSLLETTIVNSRLRGRECIPHVTKSIAQIACPSSLKSSKSHICGENAHKCNVTWFEQAPVNCKCEWRPIKSEVELKRRGLSSFEWRRCPKALELDSKCHRIGPNQYLHQKTVLKYVKDGHDCIPIRETLNNNFTCPDGTQTFRSDCDPMTNMSTEYRVTFKLENCECKKLGNSSRPCVCGCPPTRTHSKCNPETGILETTEETFTPSDCECIKTIKQFEKSVECPGFGGVVLDREEGPCEMDKATGDSYRDVTWTTGDREGCACVQRKHKKRELCHCAPRERKLTRCVDNAKREIKTLRRVLTDEKRCVEKEYDKLSLLVNCPEARVIRSVCDNKTGISTVSKLHPVIEACRCKAQVQIYKAPCRCNPVEKLVQKTPCDNVTCLSTAVYIREVPDRFANGSCSIDKIAEELKCCCPPPQSRRICDPSSGTIRTLVREFRISNGRCLPRLHVTSEMPVICPRNETTHVVTLKSGKMRVLTTRIVREGCKCKKVTGMAITEWKCPNATHSRKCIKSNQDGQFAWQTTLSIWRPSEDKVLTCNHHELHINVTPVSCPLPNVTESLCFFVDSRHGFVRNVTTVATRATGCQCVQEEPSTTLEVCNCSLPVTQTICDKEKGIITEKVIHYNISSDRSRCIPRETTHKWQNVCFPPTFVLRETTACVNGVFFKVYVKRLRDGCRCRTKAKRVAFPCDCPKPSLKSTCLDDGITQLTHTIRHTRKHLNGPCDYEESYVKKITSCGSLPAEELQPGRDYTIRHDGLNNTRSVFHVYPCGAGGSSCRQRVIKVSVARAADGCRCVVRREESMEACCCNKEGLQSDSIKPEKLQWEECDSSDHAVSVKQQRIWRLIDGECWPLTFTISTPLMCSNREIERPAGACINDKQRFIVSKSVRDGCHCKVVKSVVYKPCLCQTVSAAEVIFIVDESVSSRIPQYSRWVRDILKLTIRTFKSTHNDTSTFRFAVIKYSSDPSIAFNLGQYEDSAPMLSHLEQLNYEGKLSNLGKALDLTKREVLPRVRAGILSFIYIISDGVNDKSADASSIAAELAGAGVQVYAVGVGADARGQAFLQSLTSRPRIGHFVAFSVERKVETLSDWLIKSLCIKSCPENTQSRSTCSRDTGCLGLIYERSFKYNTDLGKCVGFSKRRPYRCCCLESPREEKKCVNGSLIAIKELWKLKTSKTGVSVCQHYKIEQDLTGELLRGCPSEEVHQGTCSSEGVRTDVTVKRTVENCECKVTRQEVTKRCLCDAKTREEKQCIGDNIVSLITRKEVLSVDGQCKEEEKVLKKTICCLAPRNTRQEDKCINRDTRVTSEISVYYAEDKRSCVTKTVRSYEPIDCPTKSALFKSECGHIGNDTNHLIESNHISDPNLLVSRVESVSWRLDDCQCQPIRRWEFEACGCREIEKQVVQECHDEQGILIVYKQNYVLSVAAANQTYNGPDAIGKRFNELNQASCRSVFSGRTISQTVCPDAAITRGPCLYDDDEKRAFQKLETRTWKREGCTCKQLPINATSELCGCRRKIWTQKRCSKNSKDMGAVLVVYHIRERLVRTSHGPVCKVDMKVQKHPIKCPLPQVHYSNCSNGEMTVTIELVSLKDCECVTTSHSRKLRCLEITMDRKELLPRKPEGKSQPELPTNESSLDFKRLREKLARLGLPVIYERLNESKVKEYEPQGPKPDADMGGKSNFHKSSPLNAAKHRLRRYKPLKVPSQEETGRSKTPGESPVLEPRMAMPKKQPDPSEKLKHVQQPMEPGTVEQAQNKPEKPHRRTKRPGRRVINFIECVDLLPTQECIELDKGPNSKCDEQGRVRDELCHFPINQTEFTMQEAEANNCLVTDLRYGKKYHLKTLKNSGLNRCKRICTSDPRCLGFDFYVPLSDEMHGSCHLSKVDRPTLQRRLNVNELQIGATAKDLLRMKSKRCIHFRRVFNQPTPLPTLNYLSNCTCENLKSEHPLSRSIHSAGKGHLVGRMHCVKKAESIHINWQGLLTCEPPKKPQPSTKAKDVNATTNSTDSASVGPCVDLKPTDWCEEVAKTGACKQKSFRAVCGGTCGTCICKRNYRYFGKCLPSGRMTVVKIIHSRNLYHGRCTATKVVHVVPCEVCPSQPYELIQPCDRRTETLAVIRVSPLLNSSHPTRCKLKLEKKSLSCAGCTFAGGYGIERKGVSECKKLPSGKHRLAVRTEYLVNESGCCVVKSSYRFFACLGCPERRISFSQCENGWQLKTVAFFTRPLTGKYADENRRIPVSACIKRVVSTKEPCISTGDNRSSCCTDLLGWKACEEYKLSGRCSTNPEVALRLCAKHCNFC
ncbi:unnamed protein product [Mesocestoides corti]|uniref:VWFA domain-containing protein n=3 Tax=Mesocestoides corti TaxID=53468 RepID=A0A158QS68_MESCO|nr:unnamed protein product [Mesocestoides corti]